MTRKNKRALENQNPNADREKPNPWSVCRVFVTQMQIFCRDRQNT